MTDKTAVGGAFCHVFDGHRAVVLKIVSARQRDKRADTYDGDKGTGDGEKDLGGGIVWMEEDVWRRKGRESVVGGGGEWACSSMHKRGERRNQHHSFA